MLVNKLTKPQDLIQRDFKLVWTNGCYDLFHFGHLCSLKEAKSFGDKLCVGVNDDESITKMKPGRPIFSLKERMFILNELECIDYLIIIGQDATACIQIIKPNVLFKGEDWKDKIVFGAEYAKELKFGQLIGGISTTNIIEKIKTS